MKEETRGPRIIRCPACQRYYRINVEKPPAVGTRLRCTQCGEVFALEPEPEPAPRPEANVTAAPEPRAPHRPAAHAAHAAAPAHPPAAPAAPARGRVLVATDGAEFQALITEVLRAVGWELHLVRSGDEAWRAFEALRPHVGLLDVALPGVPAFELCDRVRSHGTLGGTGLILIASVFQHTRYKRAPTSLYGADDYIEKHHIRDWLPGKVERLAARRPAEPSARPAPPAPGRPAAAPAKTPAKTPAKAPPAPPAAAHHDPGLDEREKETLIREEFSGPKGHLREGTARLRENLRRYARIIVSDIALYNQDLVERGIREGTFLELLAAELEEGRRLYLTRVPPAAKEEDHFEEAVRDFVSKRTAARHPGQPARGKGGHGRP
jgi:predicted Zn finger-like uncharacterized protein